jgi:hypothetical protein
MKTHPGLEEGSDPVQTMFTETYTYTDHERRISVMWLKA